MNFSLILYSFVTVNAICPLETNVTDSVYFARRASGPAGSAGVGSLHVRQGSSVAALARYGQHGTGAGQTVARTAQAHLTPKPHSYK